MRVGAASAVFVLALAFAGAASADAIQKWRTPDGELYFGDRPPAGSTLLETVPDTPVAASAPGGPTELERAAAEGRDIIRRREEARAEDLKRQAERDLWVDQMEASVEPDYYDSPLWFIETQPPCRPGEHCFDGDRHRHGHHRWSPPPPRSRIEQQWSRMNRPAPIQPRARDGGSAKTPYVR